MNKTLAIVSLTLAAALAWAVPGGDGAPIKGEVLETADGGEYIYLKLQTTEGPVWVATTRQPIPTGARVVIHDPMLMTNFQSKALKRTFEQIVFGSAVSIDGVAVPSKAQMTAAHRNAAKQTASVPVARVARAAGPEGRTVAEVHAQKTRLAGKTVDVRGTVVKYNAGIMDRNWIHLRDGSGSAADASDDLVVTTQRVAKVGDVLVVSGVVRTDVDFGAGYSYPVLVEAATLKP